MADAVTTTSSVTQKLFDELGTKNTTTAAAKDLDKNAFLKLMMEQMKSQDPTSPSGGFEQMAAQLAQYSSLEQLQNMNTNLEKLITMNTSLSTNMVQSTLPSMIGKQVKANSNAISFDGSSGVPFGYNLQVPAKTLKIDIKNESGVIVRSYTAPYIPVKSGDNTFLWDGKDNNGKTAAAGNYTFVMNGTDMQDTDLTISPSVTGKISGVRYKESGPVVIINGAEVPAGSIIELSN